MNTFPTTREDKEFKAWFANILKLAHEKPVLDTTEFDLRINQLIQSIKPKK